jgi:hypothetical protein
MKFVNKALLLAICSFALISCSDGGTDTDEQIERPDFSKYMPLNIGNYWVYNSWSVDENNNKILGSESIDSLAVVSQNMDGADKVYNLVMYRNNTALDTIKLKKSGDDMMQNGIIYDTASIKNDFWMTTMMQLNPGFWNVATFYEKMSMTFNDSLKTFDASLLYNMSQNPIVLREFNGVKVKTYSTTLKRDGKFIGFTGQKKNGTDIIDSTYYIKKTRLKQNYTAYALGIGIVSIKELPSPEYTTVGRKDIPNQYPKRIFYGREASLIRYKAK